MSAPASPVTAIVRPLRRDELPALVALCAAHAAFERAAFSAEALEERLAAALFATPPALYAWLAVIDDQAVGYASASVEFSTWRGRPLLHLDCLYLHEAVRGHGLGRQLMDTVSLCAQQLGCDAIEWQTPAWNTDGIGFYRVLGARGQEKVRFRLAPSGTMPG